MTAQLNHTRKNVYYPIFTYKSLHSVKGYNKHVQGEIRDGIPMEMSVNKTNIASSSDTQHDSNTLLVKIQQLGQAIYLVLILMSYSDLQQAKFQQTTKRSYQPVEAEGQNYL